MGTLLKLLLCASILLSGCEKKPCVGHGCGDKPSAQHRIEFSPDSQVVPMLDANASKGWEVVTCRRASSGGIVEGNMGYECIFRMKEAP